MSVVAERHLDSLVSAFRSAGLPIGPEKRIDFLRAVNRSDLTGIEDLYWVTRVTLLTTVSDLGTFDSVFEMWCGESLVLASDERQDGDEETETPNDDAADDEELPIVELGEGSGREANDDDLTTTPSLPRTPPSVRAQMAEITAAMADEMPRVPTRRLRSVRTGPILDLRKILRSATRSGGEVLDLSYRRRTKQMRKVLVLIDVSGSLRANSTDFLRFAHALVVGSSRVEVFTFGTRLTRVTSTLATDDVDEALVGLTDVVFDMDGGTRIGAAFGEFLDSSRYRTYARGALVIVLSDGLERGCPDQMAAGVERLARLSHRLLWLTPLAASPDYQPLTRAMIAIRPSLDRIGCSASLSDLQAEMTNVVNVSTSARRQCSSQEAFRLKNEGVQ